MICRAPDASSTCTGPTPTGAQLTFDAAGWLTAWQNAPTAPTSSASYLYDGDGQRVAQQVTAGGATTTTAYVGNVEEAATSGTTTTTTTYYYAADIRVALAVNGTFSYLGDDVLGNSTTAFDAAGAAQASQLYAPYGGGRYSSGTMPGSFGFTGQRADAATGLDYYVARYYDPVAGQFTSVDTVLGSNGADSFELSRYAYVEGNPASRADPTGHCLWCITALVSAVVGAAVGGLIGGLIGVGASIVTQVVSDKPIDWMQVDKEAAVGAVSGASWRVRRQASSRMR